MDMNLESRQKIYGAACGNWGKDAQTVVTLEEMAELSVELAKILNNKRDLNDMSDRAKLIDELADVSIMIEQMVFNYDVEKHVNERINFKLLKLAKFLNVGGNAKADYARWNVTAGDIISVATYDSTGNPVDQVFNEGSFEIRIYS